MMNSGLSASDVAMLSGSNNRTSNSDGMWGSGNAWWVILLFICLFGWGGFGGYGNGATGATDNYVLASDFATLQRQIDSTTSSLERKGDSIQSGLCDGFYAQNTSLLTGFGNVNQNMSTGFANAELSRANQQSALLQQMNANNVTALQNTNALQTQIADCCCANREGQAQINYNMATQSNAIQNAITNGFCQTNYNEQTNTRDVLENQNANTRAILDALATQRTEDLKTRIAEQSQQISALQLAASQAAQNQYIINQLRPAPIPAFPASNLYGYYGNGCNSCGL